MVDNCGSCCCVAVGTRLPRLLRNMQENDLERRVVRKLMWASNIVVAAFRHENNTPIAYCVLRSCIAHEHAIILPRSARLTAPASEQTILTLPLKGTQETYWQPKCYRPSSLAHDQVKCKRCIHHPCLSCRDLMLGFWRLHAIAALL